MTRTALAALATSALVLAPVAAQASTPLPSASVTGCALNPGGRYVATVTIAGARAGHAVRWSAMWVHTADGTVSELRGRVVDGRRVLRLSYTADDLLKVRAGSRGHQLLAVRIDEPDGCGVPA